MVRQVIAIVNQSLNNLAQRGVFVRRAFEANGEGDADLSFITFRSARVSSVGQKVIAELSSKLAHRFVLNGFSILCECIIQFVQCRTDMAA